MIDSKKRYRDLRGNLENFRILETIFNTRSDIFGKGTNRNSL